MAESLTPKEIAAMGVEMIVDFIRFWSKYDEFQDMKAKSQTNSPEFFVKQREAAKARKEFVDKLNTFISNVKKALPEVK